MSASMLPFHQLQEGVAAMVVVLSILQHRLINVIIPESPAAMVLRIAVWKLDDSSQCAKLFGCPSTSVVQGGT